MRLALVSLYDLENYAVRVLACYLRQRGHQVLEVYFKDWKNNGLIWPSDSELHNTVQRLRLFGAEMVGFSLRASAYLKVCTFLAEHLRRELGVPILLGGVHPTLCPESVLQLCDYVVRGEAEEAMAELLARLDAGEPTHDVANVWTLQQGQLHQNDFRPLIQDLALISRRDFLHPDKVVIDGDRTTTNDPLLVDPIYLTSASRGCPFHCSFCHNSTMRKLHRGKGKFWRLRPVDDVMEELREARGIFPHLRRIRFDDEIFPQDQAWVDEFCGRYPADVGLPFECFLEPRAVSPGRVRALAAAGLDVIYMGIQANERVSDELYQRKNSSAAILDSVHLFYRLGIDTRVQVMVDDPMSTEGDHRALFELLNAFPRPFRLYLFSMTVMPGTELERKLVSEGVITPDEVEGEATKTFSQYRVSLDWDRPPDEDFWVSMFVLVNKPFLPPAVLEQLSHSQWLRRHPRLLARTASVFNTISMASMVPASIARGEIGTRVLRRFWNPGKWITA